MTDRLARFAYVAALVAVLTPKAVWGAPRDSKIDKPLEQLLSHGCRGARAIPVIVRAAKGYRVGVANALKSHGNHVRGEFASINAVAADVSCADLRRLAGFDVVESISTDAAISAQAVTR